MSELATHRTKGQRRSGPLPFIWDSLWLTGGWEQYSADTQAVHGTETPIEIPAATRTSTLRFLLGTTIL